MSSQRTPAAEGIAAALRRLGRRAGPVTGVAALVFVALSFVPSLVWAVAQRAERHLIPIARTADDVFVAGVVSVGPPLIVIGLLAAFHRATIIALVAGNDPLGIALARVRRCARSVAAVGAIQGCLHALVWVLAQPSDERSTVAAIGFAAIFWLLTRGWAGVLTASVVLGQLPVRRATRRSLRMLRGREVWTLLGRLPVVLPVLAVPLLGLSLFTNPLLHPLVPLAGTLAITLDAAIETVLYDALTPPDVEGIAKTFE